jgi:GNAT superfamily N-acetyltransferase
MHFEQEIRNRVEKDETVQSHLLGMDLSARDVWSLDLDADWKETGRVRVGLAAEADHAALRLFLTEGLGERSLYLFAPYPMDEGLDPAIAEMLVETQAHKRLTYNAWHNGTIIGHFFLWGFTESVPGLGIAVADAFHDRKLGHLFLNILLAAGKATGKERIALTTNISNDRGFHLYGKMGFEYIGDKEISLGDGSTRVEREMIHTIT